MKKIVSILFVFFVTLTQTGVAQTNIVVSEFVNNSNSYALDAWERTIPELLQTELSKFSDITLLDRDKLKTLFKEHELALSGFADSASAVATRGLTGADFILSGSLTSIGGRYRIKVNITRVKTGEVTIELAEAHSTEYLKPMIDLLANNIHYKLSGVGDYQSKKTLDKYPTSWFAAATAGFGIAAYLYKQHYQEKYDAYKNATKIGQFDDLYDEANRAKNMTYIMAALGGTALAGTIYCWISNKKTKDITAFSEQKVSVLPNIHFQNNKEVRFSVQINF